MDVRKQLVVSGPEVGRIQGDVFTAVTTVDGVGAPRPVDGVGDIYIYIYISWRYIYIYILGRPGQGDVIALVDGVAATRDNIHDLLIGGDVPGTHVQLIVAKGGPSVRL